MTATIDTHGALQLIVTASRGAMRGQWRADSCIAATRITKAVLDYFGYSVRPAAVRVAGFTATAWSDAQAGRTGNDPARGAWSVGVVGSGAIRDGRWDGHLVAIVEGCWLLDASVEQLNRPEHGLQFAPSACPLPDGWPETPLLLRQNSTGSVLTYRSMPDRQAWRRTADWSGQPTLVRETIAAAIATVRNPVALLATRSAAGSLAGTPR
jgi:hypothetical protein